MNSTLPSSTKSRDLTDQSSNINLSAFATVAGANAVATIASLLIGIYVVRSFAPDTYGKITFLLVSFGIFRLLATFGMGNRITIDTANSIRLDQKQALNSSFYSLLVMRLSVALPLLLVAGILTITVNASYFYIVLMIIPASFSDYNLATLQGGGKAPLIAVAILSQPLIYAVLVPFFLSTTHAVESVYAALICSWFLSMIIGFTLSARLGLTRPKRAYFNISVAKDVLWFVSASFIMVILQYMFSSATVVMLGLMKMYGPAAQLGVIINLVQIPTSLLFIPTTAIFQAHFIQSRAQDRDGGASVLASFTLFAYYLSIGAAAMFAIFAKPIILFFFGDAYLPSAVALSILSPVIVASIIQNVLIFTLAGIGKPHATIGALAAQLIMNTLIIVLISLFGDANISLLAAGQSLSICVGTFLLWRRVSQELPTNWRFAPYLQAFGLAILASSSVALIFFSLPDGIPWGQIKIALSGLIYLGLVSKRISGRSIPNWIVTAKLRWSQEKGS